MLNAEHIWGAVVTLFTLLLGWLHVERREEIKEMKDDAEQTQRDLDKHKLYAAETFSRKTDVDRAIEAAEKRIKDQLAAAQQAQIDLLTEIRNRLPAKH